MAAKQKRAAVRPSLAPEEKAPRRAIATEQKDARRVAAKRKAPTNPVNDAAPMGETDMRKELALRGGKQLMAIGEQIIRAQELHSRAVCTRMSLEALLTVHAALGSLREAAAAATAALHSVSDIHDPELTLWPASLCEFDSIVGLRRANAAHAPTYVHNGHAWVPTSNA